ncbi:MAG: DNA recombination protein RmuC, partial [Muribaculaceae bacterium]|nr:DNA recombination protein RmuC [Muribaculaceae bacterium]
MLTLLVGLIAGLLIGVVATVILYRSRLADAERMNRERIDDIRETHKREIDNLTTRFKSIAGEALESNSRQLDRRSRDSIEAVLSPVRDAINRFTDDFRRMYVDDTNRQTALRESIETLRQLNLQVSDETQRLSRALRGNTAMQGQWGEMVLANILENSGLEPGRWLVYQEETRDGDQRLRPDAVIHCPRGRDIIIDAKVSLTAYLRYLDDDGDADRRKSALNDHLKSVENHIKTLRTRRYNERIGKHDPGFVLMFMPHEGAYLAALNADPDLWLKANSRGVIIVSPTHLIT